MKNLILVLAITTSTWMNAQNINTTPARSRTVSVERNAPPVTPQFIQSFYTDYDFMDEAYNVDSLGQVYSRYIWLCNMNFETTLGDTNITYPVVDFSSFWDSYSAGGPVPVSSSTIGSYTVDSVFILCGHENNSGTPDTIIINILALNGVGYPQSTVLHRDTIISIQFGAVNDWLTPTVIGIPIGYVESNGAARFGVRVEYYGARIDTFGVIAGFGDLGPGNCPLSSLYNFAVPSHYATNSYRFDMMFSYTYGILPNAAGADTYYECNGTPNKQPGVDSEHFLQNWAIWSRITTDSVGLGITESETGINVAQNIPNPANGSTLINYSIANGAGNVALEVYDVTGQLVETIEQGRQVAGQHSISLNTAGYAAGVYYYTLNVDGVKVTRKMIIGE